MRAKWDEMFGVREEVAEEVKVKKPRKKAVAKRKESVKKSTTKAKPVTKNKEKGKISSRKKAT